MKKQFIFSALAAALAIMPAAAQKKTNVLDISTSITDNSIVFPESFETDTQALLEGWYMKNYTATDNRYKTESGPDYTDAILIERLKNMPTVIDMPYNQIVRKYIDRYAKNGRKLVTACLGLGNYYLPIIEQALEAEGLPNELKYLPMIESAYNPNAVSRAGATGMWQFMLAAAKGYDMEVNSLIDERRDPFESSKKGAKLLKDLYNTYGRWDLAIAAYNCGPGTVNKALRRAGGDPKSHDFWSIYNYLPAETRGYFPMFVAANYIMNYYPDHNISPVVPTKALVTDTVGVTSRVNLNQISKVLNIPIDELRLLNPQYRADIIPGSPKRPYMLCLPAPQVHAYIMSEKDILGYKAEQYAQRVTADPGSNAVPDIELPGDDPDNALAVIDNTSYPASEETEDDFRSLRETASSTSVRNSGSETAYDNAPAQPATPAQTRERKSDRRGSSSGSSSTTAQSNSGSGQSGILQHKVAAGETLQDIAAMYGVSVDNLKIWNALGRDAVRVGQVLNVRTGNGATRKNQNQAPAQTPSQPKQKNKGSQQAVAQNQAPAAPAAQTATQQKKNTKAQGKQAMNAQQNAQATTTTGKKKKNSKNDVASAQDTGKSAKSSKNGKGAKTDKNAKADKTGKNGKGAKQAAAAPKSHEVKSGESLDRIAHKNGVTVDELRKANKNLKGDMIHPGDKLNIPKSSKNSQKATTGKNGKNGAKADTKADTKAGKGKKGAKADTKSTGSKSTATGSKSKSKKKK